MSKNIVLIGGTTGIGKALKENLGKTDVHLYIASRSATSRLESGGNITVADSEKASWITGQILGVDGGMSTIQNL